MWNKRNNFLHILEKEESEEYKKEDKSGNPEFNFHKAMFLGCLSSLTKSSMVKVASVDIYITLHITKSLSASRKCKGDEIGLIIS
jgi:hypothetical protein